MTGSIIVTFNELTDTLGGSYFDVYVNGEHRNRHFTDTTNLYTTYVNLNDTFYICYGFIFTGTTYSFDLSVSKKVMSKFCALS